VARYKVDTYTCRHSYFVLPEGQFTRNRRRTEQLYIAVLCVSCILVPVETVLKGILYTLSGCMFMSSCYKL